MFGRIALVLVPGLLMCGCSKAKSTDDLIADLKAGREKDRLIAVRLLQQRRTEATKVVPALIEAATDEDRDIRLSAVIGLGYFGEDAKDGFAVLQQSAQHDRDPRIREQAGVALSRIDPARWRSAKPHRR